MRVRDRVVMSHATSICETSWVLTVASLQRLKMKGFIPAPADWGAICDKVFEKKKKTNSAGCLVPVLSSCTKPLGHTRLDSQYISCRSSAGRCLIIIYPIVWASRPVISIFSYTSNSCPVSVSVFRMTERRRWVLHSGSNPRQQTFTTQIYKSWS